MGLTIGDDSMSSDRSPHTARLLPGEQPAWEVSWLPGRRLSRNEAITAMVLADVAVSGDIHPGHRNWPHVQGWAAELGITTSDALTRTASPPGSQPRDAPGRRRPGYVLVLAASPWAKEYDPASRANLWDALHAGEDPHAGPEPEPGMPADPEAGG